MLKQIKELSPTQRARMLSLIIIHIIMIILVGIYARSIYQEMMQALFEQVDDFYVDGDDFSGIVNLATIGLEGVLKGVYVVGSAVGNGLFSLVLLIPWRCIAIRKQSVVVEAEYRLSFWLVGGYVVLSLLVGILVSDIGYLSMVVTLIVGPTLMSLLLSVVSLESAYMRTLEREKAEITE